MTRATCRQWPGIKRTTSSTIACGRGALDDCRPPQHGEREVRHKHARRMRKLAGLPDRALRARSRPPLLANQRHHLTSAAHTHALDLATEVCQCPCSEGWPRTASSLERGKLLKGKGQGWRGHGHLVWKSTRFRMCARDWASSLPMWQGGSWCSIWRARVKLGMSDTRMPEACASGDAGGCMGPAWARCGGKEDSDAGETSRCFTTSESEDQPSSRFFASKF